MMEKRRAEVARQQLLMQEMESADSQLVPSLLSLQSVTTEMLPYCGKIGQLNNSCEPSTREATISEIYDGDRQIIEEDDIEDFG